jgi:hypothetical protein
MNIEYSPYYSIEFPDRIGFYSNTFLPRLDNNQNPGYKLQRHSKVDLISSKNPNYRDEK